MQGYSTSPSRNLIKAAQGMLEHAEPILVLGQFGSQKQMPMHQTDTLVFRRLSPFGALATGSGISNQQYVGTPVINPNNFVLAEGVTPNANTIKYEDVSVTLQDFGVLFKYSSKVEYMYEDSIPEDMQKITGETMAEVLEMVRYGVLKAGTQVVYANGSSRGSVNTVISLNRLRQAVRILESNRAKRVTSRLAPGVNFGTRAVQPAYLVFCHTDCESDVRNLPGFTKVEEYGTFKPAHEREIGSAEQFRFVTSPLLNPFLGAGSATLNGCVSIGGSNVDVYPFIVMAENAWGQVALKGFNGMSPTILRAGEKSHANPLGRFGYVGASTYFAAVRLNEAWFLRLEAGVTSL
jgi:N4-gp56 family major capsid protein